ncbi:MAG TPA: winged helix DNA-binding domain-containing protein [Methanocellaceae archaeon]
MLEKEEVNFYLLQKSHLPASARLGGVVDVIKDIGAMDSNNLEDTYFSLFLRVKGFDMAATERALYSDGGIARVKGLKNYTQVVSGDLLAAIYTMTKNGRESSLDSTLKSWGITGDEYSKLERAIIGSLGGKEKTLGQLKNDLASISKGLERGKGKKRERAMDVSVVANAMVDRWTLLRGGIGRVPGESPNRFSRFRDRFKGLSLDMDKDEALTTLARRYVAGYGPVCADDLAWWLGVQQRDALAALKKLDGLETVSISGIPGTFYMFDPDSVGGSKPETSVVFLPKDDPYVKAYRNTARFVPDGHSVITKFGESASVVLLNGVVSGTWSIEREHMVEACVVRMFEGSRIYGLKDSLEKAASEAGRFYTGTEIEVSIKGL